MAQPLKFGELGGTPWNIPRVPLSSNEFPRTIFKEIMAGVQSLLCDYGLAKQALRS
jgi:hypothetical protein